ncbi:hypothetical protein E2562_037464 [Oryza meyeriana var. granulata]|uniref:Uncharacterized protein n=1 Tax=Oryza meyeriana var. granulata TaxID=110450 RepID=A0A6G1DT12_9ORYZ|nr:hypothetical protein E2562_037464 [Oryza meyeriana var. granulata]
MYSKAERFGGRKQHNFAGSIKSLTLPALVLSSLAPFECPLLLSDLKLIWFTNQAIEGKLSLILGVG